MARVNEQEAQSGYWLENIEKSCCTKSEWVLDGKSR